MQMKCKLQMKVAQNATLVLGSGCFCLCRADGETFLLRPHLLTEGVWQAEPKEPRTLFNMVVELAEVGSWELLICSCWQFNLPSLSKGRFKFPRLLSPRSQVL